MKSCAVFGLHTENVCGHEGSVASRESAIGLEFEFGAIFVIKFYSLQVIGLKHKQRLEEIKPV